MIDNTVKKGFVYIIPFKNEKYFKIGRSSGNFNRVTYLIKMYNGNRDKTYIIKSIDNASLERYLLNKFPKCDINQNIKGHTEIREYKYFKEIESVAKSLGGLHIESVAEKEQILNKNKIISSKRDKVLEFFKLIDFSTFKPYYSSDMSYSFVRSFCYKKVSSFKSGRYDLGFAVVDIKNENNNLKFKVLSIGNRVEFEDYYKKLECNWKL